MKPIKYIQKYRLDKTSKFNHTEFVADLTLDFMTLVEFHQQCGIWNYSKFKNCVKETRQKWNSISNKTLGTGLPEKLWNYFYASVIVPIRDEMFGDYLKAKKDQYEQRKAERQRWEDPWEFYHNEFWQNMYRRMIISIPIESFQTLGLRETADLDAVKDAYRQLAKTHHPDKGGSGKEFREVTDAKNRCLAYLV